MITFRELPHAELRPIDDALMDGNQMRLLPASKLREFTQDELAVWAHIRSRYGLVTKELVEFLRSNVLGRDPFDYQGIALEIGSGMGDLAFHLELRATDSAIQTSAEMRLYYEALRQPIIDPPAWVERLDAVEAVKKYKPKIVIASWCTQLFREGDTEKKIGSSIHGIDEEWLLERVDVYVHIGNDSPHGTKRINRRKHEVIREPWLVSRAADQSLNCIRIWRK